MNETAKLLGENRRAPAQAPGGSSKQNPRNGHWEEEIEMADAELGKRNRLFQSCRNSKPFPTFLENFGENGGGCSEKQGSTVAVVLSYFCLKRFSDLFGFSCF